jgi:hypothetical protein
VFPDITDYRFRRTLGRNDDDAAIEQCVKQRVDSRPRDRTTENSECGARGAAWQIRHEILKVVKNCLGAPRGARRKEDDAGVPARSDLANDLVRLGCLTRKPLLTLLAAYHILREPRLEEVFVVGFGAAREGHQDRTHVEQTKREGDAVRVEISDDRYDVTAVDSFEPWIIELRRFLYLRKAERFPRTNQEGTLAVTLTARELLEQSCHYYAPPDVDRLAVIIALSGLSSSETMFQTSSGSPCRVMS